MAAKKVIRYLIPLMALIIIAMLLWGPGALWAKTKGAYAGAKEYLPNVTIGAEEVAGEKPTISSEHEDAIRKLVDTIEQMVDSDRTNCFANYDGLPDLGEQGTRLTLEEGRIEISSQGRMLGDLTNELKEKMEGFKPCVIAGPRAAENFYKNFLEKETCGLGSCDVMEWPYYQEVGSITLSEKEKIIYDGKKGDLEDRGWLYKDEDGLVCFFPTFGGDPLGICNGDVEGLDNDCLEDHEAFFERNKCS